MKHWLTWLLIATVLFLGGTLVYSDHVIEQQRKEMLWLVLHCHISER